MFRRAREVTMAICNKALLAKRAALFFLMAETFCGAAQPVLAQADFRALKPVNTDSARVFYSTDTFTVSEFDLEMYLRDAPVSAGEKWGSRAQVLQALSDLFALRILEGDAASESLITDAEAAWIADYAVAMEAAKRLIQKKVEAMMATTDWEQEAREHYLANRAQYRRPETLTVQTFLIKTDERSEAEAVALAESLVKPNMSREDFAEVVAEHTEDDAGKVNGGLILDLQRGRTVPPFEEAAFALAEPGEISPPTVSRFGVHVIRLLDRKDSAQLTFEDVKGRIVSSLRPVRQSEYRAAIQDEARARMPKGFMEHTGELDSLMEETSTGPLRGVPEE